MEEKKGGLVITRNVKEGNNTLIIDNRLRITVKEIRDKNVKLLFTDIGERLPVKKGEKLCP